MANMAIPAEVLQRYFSRYNDTSPLENVLTPEKVQSAIAAIGQFQQAKKDQADLKMLSAARPAGMGGIPVKSFAQLMDLKNLELNTEKRDEIQRLKQQTAMELPGQENKILIQMALANPVAKEAIMKSRPDLFLPPSTTGVYATEPIAPVVQKGESAAFIKNIKDAQAAQAKAAKDALSAENMLLSIAKKKYDLANPKGRDRTIVMPSTGTVTGDKVANFKF